MIGVTPLIRFSHLKGDLRDVVVVRERLGQRQRLGERHVHGTEGAALSARVIEDPAQALGVLARAPLLGGHRTDLVELVVDDRHRDEQHVVDPALAEGVDEEGQDPVARPAQLPRAGTPALDVALDVEALAQQVAEVLAQHGLVDRSVLHAPPDEDVAVASRDRADRPEVEVVAAEHVVRGKPVPVKHRTQDQRVHVRPVARQEHERLALAEPAQLLEAARVHVKGVCAADPAPEVIPRINREATLTGHHLVERRGRLRPHLLGVAALLGGQPGDHGLESAAPVMSSRTSRGTL